MMLVSIWARFSNISLQKNHQRIAFFDISPVNVVLNYFAEKLGKTMMKTVILLEMVLLISKF